MISIWNKIYKNYLKGGELWATLSEGIIPYFTEFVKKSKFETKHVLDIGCGTGKYLKYLKEKGFKTDGIDSSTIAVRITKDNLDDLSNILNKDIFRFSIPEGKYDLIISVATLNHGIKSNIKSVIKNIYKALISGGKIFITLPDFEETKKRNSFFRKHKKLSDGSYMFISGPEKGIVHSFFSKQEIKDLFSDFKNLKINLDNIGRWIITATK